MKIIESELSAEIPPENKAVVLRVIHCTADFDYAANLVFSDGAVIADDSSAGVLTNMDVIQRASLKETSLYTLARLCGIPDERAFVQSFIDYERAHGMRGKTEEGVRT